MKKIKISSNLYFSNDTEIKFILGPCQIESKDHAFEICSEIDNLSKKLKFQYIYKSSFDKANRSSYKSKRGLGIKKGLEILAMIKEKFDCPVTSDIHEPYHCEIAKEFLDVIQIPAFLCRQTDLLLSAGKTNLPINVKKGQFLAPWDMENVSSKISSTGNKKILLTERGTSFGYNNLVSDMRSLPIMKKTGYPVIFDATHSVQLPGGYGDKSGGQYEFVDTLAKAAVTTSISGLFMETHENPKNAPSDGPNMVPLKSLGKLIHSLKLYDNISKNNII
ncbi:MAG: 3-deoxy-8-phosphooctulonate synthase [alpha proteobacterium MED-G10]|jgi:2-dehydro-3-deoxyphosphooctonate aldolase (KDO 8-P synthase)|nr:MAG: 3-deoxy-8-phosphooctulonate synthase [alpha proteobacterium MED-G10]